MNLSKSILIIILVSFTLISCSPQPPETVINVFVYQFTNAKDISWKLEYNGLWKASFHIIKFEYMSAFYDKEGMWVSNEREVFIDDIPAALLIALQKKYPRDSVVKSFERTTPAGIDYGFEIEVDGSIIVIGYDENKAFFVMEDETFQINNEFTVEND
ncbi:hypothetical protein Aeqsu_3189 [Aequorivita sublithincola DSM 14238]|uniref:Uncharacterized protein n=1 Tax=Aequorivita sublithincola (strain DSM 14238 / LMG 21431 / ACAM 643 / 9-3) TaxID=746697 RepID=I3Z052_AEQSU|nr:hypothetical protein [Aequorivita sublithincola]AFL82620.1 hypothetical protein Aeqsu_3189 [Aequorivita sublithincola DSM 14238]